MAVSVDLANKIVSSAPLQHASASTYSPRVWICTCRVAEGGEPLSLYPSATDPSRLSLLLWLEVVMVDRCISTPDRSLKLDLKETMQGEERHIFLYFDLCEHTPSLGVPQAAAPDSGGFTQQCQCRHRPSPFDFRFRLRLKSPLGSTTKTCMIGCTHNNRLVYGRSPPFPSPPGQSL